jgi:hypothetical protein
MANSMATKLKIKPGDRLLTLNTPADFRKKLGELPPDVKISVDTKNYTQIHWFVMNKTQMEKGLSGVMKLLKDGVIVWIYYPKGSSKLQTDLTRDKGWDCLLAEDEKLTWINLVSFDETWSIFGFRAKTAADLKKATHPKKEREIFKWIDPVKKTVRIPGELAAAFAKNKQEAKYFDSLAFSHRKEYVEWIVEAKRDETREARVEGTIERLKKQWKNPRNL